MTCLTLVCSNHEDRGRGIRLTVGCTPDSLLGRLNRLERPTRILFINGVPNKAHVAYKPPVKNCTITYNGG